MRTTAFSSARIPIACLATLTMLALSSAHPVRAQVSSKGRWIGPFEWDGGAANSNCETAIHTAVLRGRGDTTIVLHFAFSNVFDSTRCWEAQPRVLVIPPNTPVTSANFAQLGQAICPAPAGTPDIFCSANVSLASGQLAVFGGTTEGINGHKQVLIFDPKHYSDASYVDVALNDTLSWGWALLESDTMQAERYYQRACSSPTIACS